MTRRIATLAVLIAAGAAPALAQPPAAPPPASAVLGLFNQRCEEPEQDPDAPQPPEATPAPVAPAPDAKAPVHVEDASRTPDSPPSVPAMAYDSRVRSSFASAEAFQGPLDGGWTLAAQGQGDLYVFQLADKGRSTPEGAWRDLRRKGQPDGSGLIDQVARDGGRLTLRFAPRPGATATVMLQAAPGGVWMGQLDDGGQTRAVTLRRTGP